MKVYYVFSLESPHRGDSDEYTQYIIFNMKKKKQPKLSQICSYGNFSKGLKNEFETAVVNEPSVFEPVKFYYNLKFPIYPVYSDTATVRQLVIWFSFFSQWAHYVETPESTLIQCFNVLCMLYYYFGNYLSKRL